MFAQGETLPVDQLQQYGLGGVIAMIGLWFFWQAYKREKDRADAGWAEVLRLNGVIQDKYVPALQAATDAMIADHKVQAELRARRRSG